MNEHHLHLFQIILRSKLDRERAAWFPEMSSTASEDTNTRLIGELPDQSALLGILFRAHNLNLQILSVAVDVYRKGDPDANSQND
jgi:hypothetical protein